MNNIKCPLEEYITDKYGYQYIIKIFEYSSLWKYCLYPKVHPILKYILFQNDNCIGYTLATPSSDILVLDDICISDGSEDDTRVAQSQSLISRWLRKPVNYRQRSLGSALLRSIIAHATDKGIKQINGRIVRKDISANPKLLDWYRKHGFIVDTIDDHTGTVARIHLILPSANGMGKNRNL